LLTTLLSAVLLPLFPLQYAVFIEQQNSSTVFQTINDTFKNIPVVSEPETLRNSFSWQQVVLVVYITGAAIFMFRLLTQTFVLLGLMVKYRIKSFNGIRIVENEKYGLPFSFFNIVFINPKFHTQDELPEILAHEKVHIRENHWFDLLFIELLTVVFWFNPFIWFFERSIKQNHEYLADRGVLAQGHTLGKYKAILVNQLMGMQIIGITNNLNFALNTNRLKMMTKKKTSRMAGVKFVWALPIVALLLFAFAEPQYRFAEAEIMDNNNLIEVKKGEKELTIHGKVLRQDSKEPIPGASVIIKGSTIGTVVDKDGTFTLVDPNPKVNADGTLETNVVISFVGLKTVVNTIASSGSAIQNAKYTFLMEDEVIYASACFGEVPPPPPPPAIVLEDTEEPVFLVVEDMPAFPGGPYALMQFIQKKTEGYNLTGKAKIGFTVNAMGKVTDVKIVENDNNELGKAAAEIITQLPSWKPGAQRGKPVPVKFLIAVEFK
jgi:hypothetical protein